MKSALLPFVSLLCLVCAASALRHRVRVYAVQTGADDGTMVEFRTRVVATFKNPFGGTQFQNQVSSIKEKKTFPAPGEEMFDYLFNPGKRDLASIYVFIYDLDGSKFNKLCDLRFSPKDWLLGKAMYQCLVEGNNGAKLIWHFNIVVNTCNNWSPCPIFIGS